MQNHRLHQLESHVSGIAWPPIASPKQAEILSMHYHLEQTQWLSAEKIQALQLQQAKQLLLHAASTVPHYRETLPSSMQSADTIDWATWHSIPILERQQVQTLGSKLVSEKVPEDHKPLSAAMTSGSTGRPISIIKTRVTDLIWQSLSLRAHLWHERDTSATLAVIRFFSDELSQPNQTISRLGWGGASELFLPKGNCHSLSITTDIQNQLRWLESIQPDYILSYPSNLAALAQAYEDHGVKLPRLSQLISIGEMVTAAQREICKSVWNVPIKDIYGAEETGYIAVQAPDREDYLVQAENVILEILDEQGQACQPGQIGRVVLTCLHNFAKPLIRYAIGDYAEAGYPSPCGRGLQTINRITGRTRNMFFRKNGDRFWPVIVRIPQAMVSKLPASRQIQYVQKTLSQIEIRINANGQRYPVEVENYITEQIRKAFQENFEISFNYEYRFESSMRGKFEDCICEVSSQH